VSSVRVEIVYDVDRAGRNMFSYSPMKSGGTYLEDTLGQGHLDSMWLEVRG
jgi:hypothetical protein